MYIASYYTIVTKAVNADEIPRYNFAKLLYHIKEKQSTIIKATVIYAFFYY